MTVIRGSLIGQIYKHSLCLPASESNIATSTVSLLVVDIERIQQTLQWVFTIIPNLIQVALGLWILETHLGVASVAPVIVALGTTHKSSNKNDSINLFPVSSVMSVHVGRRIPSRQRRWMEAIQRRVGIIANSVGDIQAIKMTGLAPMVTKQIQSYREHEIADQKAFRRLQVTNITLGESQR